MAETKQPGIMDRFTSAVAAWRGEDDLSRTKVLNIGEPEQKGVRFPQERNGWSGAYRSSYAGTAIDYKTEAGDLMQSSLVMAVLNFTATTLPEAPLQVMKTEGGAAVADPAHKLAKLLKRPNTYYSGNTMWAGFSISWWIDGNVYLIAVPSARGEIVELWYYPHFLIEPRWPGDGKSPGIKLGDRLTPDGWINNPDEEVFISCYEYTVGGKKYQLAPEYVIHFRRGINPQNTRKGLGAFDPVLRQIYGYNAQANFSAALMRNYGVISHLVTPKEGTMEVEDARSNKALFAQQTTGDNVGSVIFNTMALEVQRMGMNPQELDLSRLGLVPESSVASVTGIPAAVLQFMVGLENGTSYASYEQAKKQAYESVIFPIQSSITSEVDAQMLPLFDGKDTSNYSEFDTSKVRVLQEDHNKLVNRAVIAYKGALITRARGKSWIGETPAEDGSDDVYFGQQPKTEETDNPPSAPKQLQSKSLKSVEWDGLTLSREPNDMEKIAVKAISEAQESGKQKIAKTLLKLRESLSTEAVDRLLQLDSASYHTLTLEPPASSRKTLRGQLASVYLSGQEQVALELAEQSGGKSAHLQLRDRWIKADSDGADELDTLADTILSTVTNDVQAQAARIALRLAAVGLSGADLRKRIAKELDALSTSAQEQAASGAANVALGMGRADEAEARSDEWKSIQYSALLDRNTCSSCEESDGQEAESEADLPPAPNSDCDGGWLCRCFLIYVAV